MKSYGSMIFAILIFLVAPALAQESKRSKNINFEDELVEGINRKPLDAFNQISERNKKQKNHLYKKRSGFTDRDETLLTEMRLLK
ncbi:MAG: hypothetical protein KGP28_09755 [Bdellovibrionales bacterium]|nr:hypothetical protein [Bdellovibrionales bacterium]